MTLARFAAVLPLALLVGCSSTRLPGSLGSLREPTAPRILASSAPGPSALEVAPEVRAVAAPAPVPALLGGGGGYTGVKGGVFLPSGDLSSLDTGASAELVFGHDLIKFLSIEGSVGFLSADGNGLDMQAIPLYVQARANLPITVLEFYGGLGVGAMYVDVNGQVVDGDAVGRVSESEFTAAANAFLGLEFGLDSLAVGVEGKYHRADEVGGFEVEGTSLMVTGRLPF